MRGSASPQSVCFNRSSGSAAVVGGLVRTMGLASTMTSSVFVLSPRPPKPAVSSPDPVEQERWRLVSQAIPRPAFLLAPGEKLFSHNFEIDSESVLHARFGPSDLAKTRAGVRIEFMLLNSDTQLTIATLPLSNAQENADVREFRLSLRHVPKGSWCLSVAVTTESSDRSEYSGVALYDLAIGPQHQMEQILAKAFDDLRRQNENLHIQHVAELSRSSPRPVPPAAPVDATEMLDDEEPEDEAPARPPARPKPLDGEGALNFSMRLLSSKLRVTAPAFGPRFQQKSQSRRLNILTFGTTTGEVEIDLLLHQCELLHAARPPRLTLTGPNADLLSFVTDQLPAGWPVTIQAADSGRLVLPSASFDLAICVSAVHRIFELESLWRTVRDALRPNGELWLIGSHIGPSGFCLDPEAYSYADALFRTLPESHRRNAMTGQVDKHLPNGNLAEATYDGIRTDEIETTLGRFFFPLEVFRRNCLLWRLLGPAYGSNFDLSRPRDLAAVDRLVEKEIQFFLAGGRPSELHGIYRPIC